MERQGLFFSLGQTEQDYGPESVQVPFICQPPFLCLCLSLFVGPGGSELNLLGGGCRASECCEALGLSNW